MKKVLTRAEDKNIIKAFLSPAINSTVYQKETQSMVKLTIWEETDLQ